MEDGSRQLRVKKPQYEAAEAEAKRRREETGVYINWTDVIHDLLERELNGN